MVQRGAAAQRGSVLLRHVHHRRPSYIRVASGDKKEKGDRDTSRLLPATAGEDGTCTRLLLLLRLTREEATSGVLGADEAEHDTDRQRTFPHHSLHRRAREAQTLP